MKKIILNVAVILGFALFIFSCGDDDTVIERSLQDDIVGQWRHNSVSLSIDGVSYPEYLRLNYPDLIGDQSDAEIESDINEQFDELLGDVLDMRADGTFIATYSDSEPDTGKWSAIEETQTLIFNIDDPDDEFEDPDVQLAIDSFTDNELTVSLEFDGPDAFFGLLEEEETLKITVSFDRL